MTYLQGEHIRLRALEPEDLEYLYTLENDPEIWEISGTLAPYSRKVLSDYLNKAHQDIYEAKQLRLVICGEDLKPMGLVDLYDFNPRHLRAGVGIVISRADARDRGFGREALELLCEYTFGILQLHQVYAIVAASNSRSRHLFEKLGFHRGGVRKEWLRTARGFEDVLFYQKLNEHVS
jgi:diamine N-acetyltransferase